jgi:bifunctional DNA-binding transcriptional regulator/antitoxin component of YhaV-PrlF toxin-antitoxin module
MTVVTLETDENGDLIFPLSDELCAQLGWKIGDTIEWINNNDGSWSIGKKKMEKELVMVECVSTFRMRYVVEVPKGKKEWALDTVVMHEAEEFSQEYIGEQILSHRVIDEKEYLKIFNEDNAYLSRWKDEEKFNFVKRWVEESAKDVERSKAYYDTERNK